MSKQITVMVMFAAVSLFVAATGCDLRHPANNQGTAGSSAQVANDTAPVEATLRPSERHGYLEIEIKNTGTRPFTFLDVSEGNACCEEFWEVEVRLASGKTLKPKMFYSPVELPWKASIEAGKAYVREIQPGAYVEFYRPKADEEGTITVHYRVKHPEDWATMLSPPYPTFSTRPLNGKLADFLVH